MGKLLAVFHVNYPGPNGRITGYLNVGLERRPSFDELLELQARVALDHGHPTGSVVLVNLIPLAV